MAAVRLRQALDRALAVFTVTTTTHHAQSSDDTNAAMLGVIPSDSTGAPISATNTLPVGGLTNGTSGLTGNGVMTGGSDGSNYRHFRTDPSGNQLTTPIVGGNNSGGIPTVGRLVSAANTTNATSVKGGQGKVYKIHGYNAAASVRYLKLYNKATAPTVGTDTPLATLAVGPSAAFTYDFGDVALSFTVGIAFALTTGSADGDTTAVTAADIVGLNIFYL